MEFSPHKNKSNVYCCVYGCKSHASKHETVRFHVFPKKNDSFVKILNIFNAEELIDRRDAWIKVLRMGKKVSPSMRVCSRHFTEHDYIPSVKQQHYLKKTAVPSINLPKSSVDCSDKLNHTLSSQREERQIRRSSLKHKKNINANEQTATISSDNHYNDNLQSFEDSNNVTEQRSDKEKSREKVTAEEEKEEDLGLQNDQLSGIEQAVKTFDCGIQSVIDKIVQNLSEIGINIGDKIIFPRLSSVILTENSENNSLCSPRKKTVTENNLTLIKVIEKFELCTKRNIEMSVKKFNDVGTQVRTDNFIPKFSEFISNDHELSTLTGIPNFCLLYTIKKLVDKQRPPTSHSYAKLDSLEVIIMTFMKLKQNMSYALLAILFKSYTPETCKDRIFHMIDILYKCLKPAILWPSKENILKNIPLDFVGFENVRAVIDCTEIPIQRPKNLCCQIVTYSRYKSCYTVKFMTAVTPAGLISFISKPYGGRASDNAVFEQSEIIKKFDKKDAVMTDRGFTVDDLCQRNDVKLISPPFLKDKKQFSKMEAMNGRKIAKARVHVKRSNQRIKIFEILSSKMPIGIVHKIEEIFTIICAIVNLSQPILKDEKFIQD